MGCKAFFQISKWKTVTIALKPACHLVHAQPTGLPSMSLLSKKLHSDKLPNCLFHSSYVPSSLKETEGLTSCIAFSKSYKNKPERNKG